MEKELRQTALKQSREVLDENNAEIQQWGVRRLDDRPAKFEYWSQLLREMIYLAEHGDWGEVLQARLVQIYGQHPSRQEEAIYYDNRALARKCEADGEPLDPNLGPETLAWLRQQREEVEREYALYRQREKRHGEAQRGACGIPDTHQFVVAHRISEATGRDIRQTIKTLIDLKRRQVELPGLFSGASCGPEPGTAKVGAPCGAAADQNEDKSHHVAENTGSADGGMSCCPEPTGVGPGIPPVSGQDPVGPAAAGQASDPACGTGSDGRGARKAAPTRPKSPRSPEKAPA